MIAATDEFIASEYFSLIGVREREIFGNGNGVYGSNIRRGFAAFVKPEYKTAENEIRFPGFGARAERYGVAYARKVFGLFDGYAQRFFITRNAVRNFSVESYDLSVIA